MLPFEMLVITNYTTIIRLNLNDSLPALIIPFISSSQQAVFRFAEIGEHQRAYRKDLPTALRYSGGRTNAPLEMETGHAPPGSNTSLHEFA